MPSHPRGRLVALEGPSAVGKTSVGPAVAAATGFVFLPEAFVLLRPHPSLRFDSPRELAEIERRLLAAERRRARAVEQLRRHGVDVLLDTAPIGPAAYSLGVARLDPRYRAVAGRVVETVTRDLRGGRLPVPDRVVYLSAPSAVLRRRADASGGTHPEPLRVRHWAVAHTERRVWASLAKRRPCGVRMLSAAGTLPTVARRVALAVRRTGQSLTVEDVVRGLREARTSADAVRKASVKNRASSRRPPRR